MTSRERLAWCAAAVMALAATATLLWPSIRPDPTYRPEITGYRPGSGAHEITFEFSAEKGDPLVLIQIGETSDRVALTLRARRASTGSRASADIPYVVTLRLAEPLGARLVVDDTGAPLVRIP